MRLSELVSQDECLLKQVAALSVISLLLRQILICYSVSTYERQRIIVITRHCPLLSAMILSLKNPLEDLSCSHLMVRFTR